MDISIVRRAEGLAKEFLDGNGNETVRSLAIKNCVSKSTVHKDLTKVLGRTSLPTEEKARVGHLLKENFNIKHIRGGEATRIKFETNIKTI